MKMLRKITSALADSRIYLFIHEDDDIGHCMVVITIFLSVLPSFSPSVVVTMPTSKPTGVC